MNAIPPFAHLCEPAASLEDGHGRTVRYIRLSVTDRCNLRCTYCPVSYTHLEEPVYVSWSGSSCRLWAWPDDLEPLAIGHVLLDRRHLGPEAGPSPFRMSGSVRAVSVPPGIDAKHAFAVELKRMEKKGHDETPSIVMTPDAIVKHMDAFLTLEGSCPCLLYTSAR